MCVHPRPFLHAQGGAWAGTYDPSCTRREALGLALTTLPARAGRRLGGHLRGFLHAQGGIWVGTDEGSGGSQGRVQSATERRKGMSSAPACFTFLSKITNVSVSSKWYARAVTPTRLPLCPTAVGEARASHSKPRP